MAEFNRPVSATDGATQTVALVVFPPSGDPSWQPFDLASVEALMGRRL